MRPRFRPAHRLRGCLLLAWLALPAGCPGARDIPPAPAPESESETKRDEPPPLCAKAFPGPGARKGACCVGASIGILKSADITATCGVSPALYLGEAADGYACRYHFDAPGADPKESYVMLTHPVIPTGARAPVAPDPMLPWTWKKIPLRDAIGYQAQTAPYEPGLLERQTILWAGRGRRIVALHVGKKVCSETQARALLQKAIDGVP